MTRALVLDCDGVLADTERHGHLPAFNTVFEENSLPLRWTSDDYARLLAVGGGKERLAAALTADIVAATGLPTGPGELDRTIRAWHARKTEIYTDLVARGTIPARDGVNRLVTEAFAAGWQVAIASTSADDSVRAVVNAVFDEALVPNIAVFAGDIVEHKKPAPDIYLLAAATLGASADEVVVIEDSPIGCAAAVAAGLACVVTESEYTRGDSFPGAALVLSSLGEPGGPTAEIVSNPYRLSLDGCLRIQDLDELMETNQSRTGAGRE